MANVEVPTSIRDICWSHDAPNLLHALEIGTETTVHCEDFLVDNGSDGQAVKAVRERLPQLDIVPSFTCK